MNLMASISELLALGQMKWTASTQGHLALCKGEGEGEGHLDEKSPVSLSTPHLSPLPSARGEAELCTPG
jgi:hypothetical protein